MRSFPTNRRTALGVGLAAGAAALGVGACGRSSGAGPAKQGQPISSGPAKGALTMWAMGTEGDKLPALAREFEKQNPGVKITVTAIPWDSAYDKFTTAVAAKKTPDLAMIGSTWMGALASANGLDPMPPGLIKPADFFPGPMRSTMVGGATYGVPWYAETRVLFYRTDLAAKAGVVPPKTWPELKTFATALRAKGGARFGLALTPGGEGSWNTFMPFAWQAGASITAKDGKTFSLNSPEMVRALDFYRSMYAEKLVPPTQPIGQPVQDFVAGRVGSFVSGPYDMTNLADLGGPGFKQKYALAPLPAGRKSASFAGGGNLAVFVDSKNRDAAWKFVRYLSQPATQVRWYRTSNDLPAVTSSWRDPALANDKYLAVLGQQLTSAQSPPAISTWEQIAKSIDGAVERMARQTQTASAAAAQIQQECQQVGTGV